MDKEHLRFLGLDSKDAAIMYELDLDCRQSNAEIGRKVRLDKSVVGYRIDKLMEKGLIREFYTVVDYGATGYVGYRTYLKWQFVDKAKEAEIINYLKSRKSVWWVSEITGYWNLGFVFWAKDFTEFEEFWFEFLKRYQGFISKKVLAIYHRLYDCNYSFLCPEKAPHYSILGKKGRETLSESDTSILDAISASARKSTVKIAEETGLSVATVKQRIKSMQKRGIIKAFRAKIDEKRLGYSLYKINFFLSDLSNHSKMLEFCLSRPDVAYVPVSIGFADFEAEIMARSNSEVEDFINEFLGKYAASVRSYDYFVFTKAHKVRYW